MKFHRLLGFEKEGPGRNFSPAFEKSLEGPILDGPYEEIDKKDRSPDEVDHQGDSSGSYLLRQEFSVQDDHHKGDVGLSCCAKPVRDQPDDIRSLHPDADETIYNQRPQYDEVPESVSALAETIRMFDEEGIGPHPSDPIVDGELRVEESKDQNNPEKGKADLAVGRFEDFRKNDSDLPS